MKAVALEEEPIEMYQIKLTKNKVTFIDSTPQTPLKSSTDIETRINPKEILLIVKEFNVRVKGNRIFLQTLKYIIGFSYTLASGRPLGALKAYTEAYTGFKNKI